MSTEPTVAPDWTWRVVKRVMMASPRRTKVGVAVYVLSALISIIAVIGSDLSALTDPQELLVSLGVILGSIGMVAVGLGYLLHSASDQHGCNDLRALRFERPRAVTQSLLALPPLGVLAGALVGAAITLVLLRALVKGPLLLVPAAVYGGLLVMSWRMVTRTTRFLYDHAREQAEAAAAARAQAVEAELSALQAQMNPHFLFNTLNTVAALARSDAGAAERTVEHLSGMLRRTLDRSRRTFSTLEDEVDYVRSYLGIEQERLGERLAVRWSVDERTRVLKLPTMTFQPLVENALKYAVNTRLDGGELRIVAERSNGRLRLAVEDDGPGFPRRYEEGTGLGNLRRRLDTIYGERAKLTVGPGDGGARVVIELPAEESE